MIDVSRSRPVIGVLRCHTADGAAQLGSRRDVQVDAQRLQRLTHLDRRPVGARAGSWPTRPARRRWPGRSRGSAERGADPANGRQVTTSPRRATSSSGLAPISAVPAYAPPAAAQVDEIRTGRGVLRPAGAAWSRTSIGASATEFAVPAPAPPCAVRWPGLRVGAVPWRCGRGAPRVPGTSADDPHRGQLAQRPSSGSASVNRTDCGRISAAGWIRSKGNAPNMIGASPRGERRSRVGEARVGGVHAVGRRPRRRGPPARTTARASRGQARVGVAGQSERADLAHAVLEAAHRDRRRRPSRPGSPRTPAVPPIGSTWRGRSGRARRTRRRETPCAPAPARWRGRRAR